MSQSAFASTSLSFDPVTLVSQDPANYRDAPTEGIRRILETVTGTSIPRGRVLKTDKIGPLCLHPVTYFLL